MLFLICHSAPALSVVMWVYSFIKAAANPASSVLASRKNMQGTV